ncbi:Mannose-binding lectin [Penicillium hordei]|uniref:Mannose-binding lectin n=1 Tax=Penicillium hordei TaxID=40994 RepID=A0AAD6GUL6_9EURO|nr:Mannose-binding lectin [Penicillium hordei]KAJ5589290.1 Mannose-binding lectin [Penicillium hordei]
MPAPQGMVMNGPYGGPGGGGYDEEDGEHKVRRIDAWGRSYNGYDVLNGFQFTWDDGVQGNLIGNTNDNIYEFYEFNDGETIDSMTVYAGDGEGYVNGFEFDTNLGGHYSIGGTEGKVNYLENLGTGDLTAAAGRDSTHGSGDVVDSIDIYFKT